MPFYEYQCSSCGHDLEVLQKISDEPLRKCPECGRNALTKLVSAPVFRLKGSGWYETDFKSDKEGRRNLVGDSAEQPASSGDAKAEPAPAKASEAKPDNASAAPKGDAPAKSARRSSATSAKSASRPPAKATKPAKSARPAKSGKAAAKPAKSPKARGRA